MENMPLAQGSTASTARKLLRMAFICQQCKQPLQVSLQLPASSISHS
jgi:hypothetical protein